MGSSEKFCLRWNDWTSHLTSAFHELRFEDDFYDVTLASDDHQEIQAHQLVLSACSPWFKNALQRHGGRRALTKGGNLVLYLRGIAFHHLEAILNFIYHGEVNVDQDELNDFLEVAEELAIKGLTSGDQAGEAPVRSKPAAKRPRGPSFTPPVPTRKPKGFSSSSSSGPKPSTSSDVTIKQEQLNAEEPDYDASDAGGAEDDDYYDDDYQPPGGGGGSAAKKRKTAGAAGGSGNGSFAEGQGDDDQEVQEGEYYDHYDRKDDVWVARKKTKSKEKTRILVEGFEIIERLRGNRKTRYIMAEEFKYRFTRKHTKRDHWYMVCWEHSYPYRCPVTAFYDAEEHKFYRIGPDHKCEKRR